MLNNYLVINRISALFLKETYIMLRDPIIFFSIIIFPILQLILLAAIFNVNPHHLPTSVLLGENTPITRSLLSSFTNSAYFDITSFPKTEAEAERLLKSGKVRFIINVPPGFTRDVIRGNNPSALVTADASNPLIVTGALSSIGGIANQALNFDLVGPLANRNQSPPPFNLIVQQRYNPDIIAQYYTVPSLVCMMLFLTTLMLSSSSIAKEKGEGTMESLLTTPAQPIEVILAKMLPFIFLGYAQLISALLMTHFIFHIPFFGNIFLLLIADFPIIISVLGIGLICSTLGPDIFTSLQYSNYYFTVSVIFAGFLFPYDGMPQWAKAFANLLPLTHFLRINLGITLKGNTFLEIWPDLWPVLIFMFIAIILGIRLYNQTLD